ncbi:hypothetical protein [Acidaminobacter hydrogenoformans]|uniref:Uncharacterized protein n=1 Tax=Acidaminobacter hydrogenoformans DSM 2784 TaxID=1120920 RepID=A0A1G5S205_9FIRM|nr:hypothetical protein [Acidaminobacter hydrogenoformans]SCZ80425.1 hypothetical protein SAMN03080599_02264 [Acidaminobacter hydrogenoformans DSM 2784]
MKALFGRKISDIEELIELTDLAIKDGFSPEDYVVTKEVILSDSEFKELTADLLKDQAWIIKDDGGPNEDGEVRCIRVINQSTREKLLINSEGYDYP